MKKKIAKSAVAKSFPFDIKKIKLRDVSWDVNEEFTTLTLEKCKVPFISNIPKEKIGFGLYAYEGNSEAFLGRECRISSYLWIVLRFTCSNPS